MSMEQWSQRPDALERDFEFEDFAHSEGGLTDADHAIARRIDEVAGG